MKTMIRDFQLQDTTALTVMFPEDWNFDFHFFSQLYFPTSFFKGFTMTHNNTIIGFGNVFLFNNISWLGNIIIDKNYRGSGLGTMITKHLIDYGKSKGANTHQLIATELGKRVYNKLGFQIDENYDFFNSDRTLHLNTNTANIKSYSDTYKNNILNLDYKLTGEDRSRLIKLHLKNSIIYIANSKIEGFYLPNLAYGLIIANNKIAGQELLKIKINKGATHIVITENNVSAKELLLDLKFEIKNKASRMILGEKCIWEPKSVYSRGAGYCG